MGFFNYLKKPVFNGPGWITCCALLFSLQLIQSRVFAHEQAQVQIDCADLFHLASIWDPESEGTDSSALLDILRRWHSTVECTPTPAQPTPTPTPTSCPDLNGDGFIDLLTIEYLTIWDSDFSGTFDRLESRVTNGHVHESFVLQDTATGSFMSYHLVIRHEDQLPAMSARWMDSNVVLADWSVAQLLSEATSLVPFTVVDGESAITEFPKYSGLTASEMSFNRQVTVLEEDPVTEWRFTDIGGVVVIDFVERPRGVLAPEQPVEIKVRYQPDFVDPSLLRLNISELTQTGAVLPSPQPIEGCTATIITPEVARGEEAHVRLCIELYNVHYPGHLDEYFLDMIVGNSADPSQLIEIEFNSSTYLVAKYEVSNAAFERFIHAGGYSNDSFWTTEGIVARDGENWTQPGFWGDPRFSGGSKPVVGVSVEEGIAFCNFLSDIQGYSRGYDSEGNIVSETTGYRLSTEEEWEYFASAGDGRTYPWGDETAFDQRASHDGSTDGFEYSAPIASFPEGQSPFGLMDMAGNVSEFVHSQYPGYPNVKGGDWHNPDSFLLIEADNWGADQIARASHVGLRIMRRVD